MPEKEVILRKTSLLPLVKSPATTGRIYQDNEIWEGDENQAHFKITKEKLPFPQLPPIYSLSVSGKTQVIEKVIADFKNAFGEPLIRNTDPSLPGIHFVLWDATKIDRQR